MMGKVRSGKPSLLIISLVSPSCYSMQPIAHLRSPWREKFGVPRQPGLVPEAWGEIDFVDPYGDCDAREGLQGFSHLWITFLFDQVPEGQTRLRVRPPRLGGNEKIGVFATRSPFRPNRIGLSVCEIETVFPVLRVKGVDIVDGTPILDIRPYVPYVDAVPEAQSGFANGPPPRMEVAICVGIQPQWHELAEETQALITGLISLQPHPAYQTGEKKRYRARVSDYEVQWRGGVDSAVIDSLEPA